MKKIFTILFMMIFLGTTIYSNEGIKVVVPDGIPSLAVVKMINEDKIIANEEIEYKIEKLSESLVMNLMKKNSDIAIVPSNLAGQLYNKKLGYKIVGTTGWGSFYIISRENIKSIEELRGREVYTIGKGLTPDIIFKTILKENGITPEKDLEINYLAGGNELAPLYLARKIDIAVISEPILSRILSKDKDSMVNLSLNEEWKRIFKVEYPQSTVIVSDKLLLENPKLIEEFVERLKDSITFIKTPSSQRYEYVKNSGITTIGEDILPDIIKRANINFISAEDGKKEYESYFKKIVENDKKAIGGKIPNEEIFISK